MILFNNVGIASSTGEVPTTFAAMAKNAEAFIDALGLKQIDLLGFSIGGMVAQQIALDRPDLIRKLILVGTAPRDHDAGDGRAISLLKRPRSSEPAMTRPGTYG